MAHVRKQIRDAIVTALGGLTTTGANVEANRARPYAGDASPSLNVTTPTDSPDYGGGAAMGASAECAVDHELEVHVEGYAGDDDTLDQIAAEVEAAMFADYTFGGLAFDLRLGVQSALYDDDGDRVEGVIDMVYLVQYRATAGSPESTT